MTIEPYVTVCRGRRAPRRAAHQRAHPRHELVRAERLRQVVVGADLEADDAVGLLGTGREHDDRNRRRLVRSAADETADLEAVDVRQHEIQDHQIGRPRADGRERVAARRDHVGHEARFCRYRATSSAMSGSSSTTRMRLGMALNSTVTEKWN